MYRYPHVSRVTCTFVRGALIRSSQNRVYSSGRGPLRACVVGSGPSGFYTAYRLMNNIPHAVIDMYESLPVPFGLVRYGVAPDHPEVKNVMHKFDEVAQSPNFHFYGNVTIGRDIAMKELVKEYDCLVLAYGASEDRKLGIEGEEMPGVLSARSFVGWYNGLPECRELCPPLDTERAVIIGQGNVALDIARILLSNPDKLAQTDMAPYAVDALRKSKVEEVLVVGRRGPLEASFTIKEAREMLSLERTRFRNSQLQLHLDVLKDKTLPRPRKRLIELLSKAKPDSISQDQYKRSWDLQYCLSPTKFIQDAANHLESVQFVKNKLDYTSGNAKAVSTEEVVNIKAGLAFKSVGYRSIALEGMEDVGIIFNTRQNVVPNVDGKVTSLDGAIPGIYASGWVKNGPVGVIATNMYDAFATADRIALDWNTGERFLGESTRVKQGFENLKHLIDESRIVTWEKWKKSEQGRLDMLNHEEP